MYIIYIWRFQENGGPPKSSKPWPTMTPVKKPSSVPVATIVDTRNAAVGRPPPAVGDPKVPSGFIKHGWHIIAYT